MKRVIIVALSIVAIVSGCGQKCENDKKIEAQVEKTLKNMTLEEKAGQMIQISIDVIYDIETKTFREDAMNLVFNECKVGSILNVPGISPSHKEYHSILEHIQQRSIEVMGIPCIYGLDMIHGASYYSDGTFFPQEINLAATFDTAHASAMGEATGYETRAGMVPWVFSPTMDLLRHAAWPRIWESFGEDPYLQSKMAAADVRAIQGDCPNRIDRFHCAVSLKHYMGYGNPTSGKDRTPAIIAENDLREKYFEPFKACIEAGALTLMVNSASINGVPTHANYKLLTEWVKEGLDWDGMIVSDWADINNFFERDHVAKDKKDAIRLGINSGIDMIMETYDPTAAKLIVELVNEGLISRERLDDAVRRILRLKYRLNLFDEPMWEYDYPDYGCRKFIDAARLAALESEVLLKNNGILPLGKCGRILVTGPNANSIRTLNGGWSYSWQGTEIPGVTDKFNTIYEAISNKFGKALVNYVPGVSYSSENIAAAAAVAAARSCDVIIVCIGEDNYCETPGNIDDLSLADNQSKLIQALAATGKPIILVLNEGRPRIIREIEPLADAIIDIMLPGNYGADALAELIAGDENFSGKLPFTYPKYVNSLHTYDYKVSENRAVMEGAYNYDAVMDVQWPFGFGLSYTKYKYDNISVDRKEFKSGEIINVSVDVTNTGSVAGKEAVILYSSDLVASLIPDVRRVRAFEKVKLNPGETRTVSFALAADDLAFVGADGRWRLEAGEFRLSAGGQGVIINCSEDKIWKGQNK